MAKFDFEGYMEVTVEDSGCARIGEVEDLNDESVDGLFVRIQSWCDNKQHEDFSKLEGRLLRVTIEVLGDDADV